MHRLNTHFCLWVLEEEIYVQILQSLHLVLAAAGAVVHSWHEHSTLQGTQRHPEGAMTAGTGLAIRGIGGLLSISPVLKPPDKM